MRISIVGLILAGLYLPAAVWMILVERGQPAVGGWISLRYIGSFMITFPIAAPAEWLGLKLNFAKNFDAAIAVVGCTALFYAIGWAVQTGYVLLRDRF